MSIERLSGGLTPADGSDPRTFPEIFNGFADEFEEVQTRGFRFVETVTFTSNGTFSKGDYPWLRAIRVKCQGGGGGGGGGSADADEVAAGSGGGGGTYAESFITNISGLASSVTITVGGGGAGGKPGNGAVGGESSFGAIVSADGGPQGLSDISRTPPSNIVTQPSSTTGVGDLIIDGTRGGGGLIPAVSVRAILSGNGGPSFLGGGGDPGRGRFNPAQNGRIYGGGGGGNGSDGAGSIARSADGGDGADGVVIVDLFA